MSSELKIEDFVETKEMLDKANLPTDYPYLSKEQLEWWRTYFLVVENFDNAN